MDYYFMVVILKCCILYSIISASTITVDPQNTDTFEGANVTLYCTVQNLGGNTVVWRDFDTDIRYSENRTIVAPSELQPGRYKITGNDTEGTFNLEITGITKSLNHNKKYQCTVPGANVFGKAAELQVYDMPPSPFCSVPRRNNDFVEGEDVSFECTFESILPKVEMNLTRNGNTLSSAIVDPDLNFRRSEFSSNFSAKSDDNGALLRCSVDHQILSMPYECSLTLNVMYKPIVEITKFGMIADGNASFTCDAVSNPNATQSEWTLCPGDTDEDCYKSGNGTLTVEPDDSEGLLAECEVFGSNVSCYIFRNGENELPIYLVLLNDNLTIPNNMTVDTDCSLKCSVRNSIGEGSDEYTINNSICVMAIEPSTVVPTTPMPPTTTAAPLTTAASLTTPSVSGNTGSNGTIYRPTIMTTVASLTQKKDDNEDEIKTYYYIIGGLAGGTLFLFMFTIIILICRKDKHERDEDSVRATQWTHYSNNAYEDSGGRLGDRKESIIYNPDNPFKTFGKEDKTPSDNPPESTAEKVNGDVHDRDTLPMPDDPEKVVELAATTGSRDTYLTVIPEPQDTAATQADESFTGRDEPPPDVLESVDGVQYTDFTDQPQSDLSTFKSTEGNTAEVNQDASPSITQI